jgi:agmatinase
MSVFHLIGLPSDSNSSFERGPALAPAAIREALWSPRGNLACENGMEVNRDFQLVDQGDLVLDETAADDGRIAEAVSATVAAGAIPILLGGDHAVTAPILAGLQAHHAGITILHFDAHPDIYDDFKGNPRSHASPFARIMERSHAARLVQVGIRTMNAHCQAQADRFGIEVVSMRGFTPEGVPLLSGPVYISLDMDGLDPAYAPGVSHPEPGGLSVREVLAALDRITGPIIGADIVELNPRFDVNGVTAIAAAKFVREIAARAKENQA